LQRWSEEQTVQDALAYTNSNGTTENAALLGPVALVARDSTRFETIAQPDEQEPAAFIL